MLRDEEPFQTGTRSLVRCIAKVTVAGTMLLLTRSRDIMRKLDVTAGLFARTMRSKPEDAITEVLAALLRSDDIGLHVTQALLPNKSEQPEQVYTQWLGADSSRVDLVLCWPGEKIAIESKFGAPLQEAQRNGYRTALSRETPLTAFYFLAPAARQDELQSATKRLKPRPGFITWESVHEALSQIRASNEHERVWLQELLVAITKEANLMDQLRQLTDRDLEILSAKETGPAIVNCMRILDALQAQLEDLPGGSPGFVPSSKCYQPSSEEFEYGFDIKPIRDVEGWVGLSTLPWRQGCHSPLGIGLWHATDKNMPPIIQGCSDDIIIEEDRWKSRWIPLRLSTQEPDALVQDLRRQLNDIYSLLRRR